MRQNDLFAVLKYGNHLIRVGLYCDKIILSLADLRLALGLPVANVTNITKNLPFDVYFRAATVDLDGTSSNATCIAVTRIGAYMALAKTQKVDPVEIMKLMGWVERLNENKLKKGA